MEPSVLKATTNYALRNPYRPFPATSGAYPHYSRGGSYPQHVSLKAAFLRGALCCPNSGTKKRVAPDRLTPDTTRTLPTKKGSLNAKYRRS